MSQVLSGSRQRREPGNAGNGHAVLLDAAHILKPAFPGLREQRGAALVAAVRGVPLGLPQRGDEQRGELVGLLGGQSGHVGGQPWPEADGHLAAVDADRYRLAVTALDVADLARPPTLIDKKMFSQNIYNISAEDLGKVVQLLDQRCEVRCARRAAARFAPAAHAVRSSLPGLHQKAGPGGH